MTYREPPPDPIRSCPWCGTSEHVQPATEHERERTGCAWWCSVDNAYFTGSATEFQRIRVQVLTAQAEAMATSPKENRP